MKKILQKTIVLLAVMLAVGCLVIICLSRHHASPFYRQNGWVERDGVRCYYIDGNPASGWLELEDGTYCFSPSGTPFTGWQQLDGKLFYFGTTGALYCGWLEENGSFYYLSEGQKQYGWLDIGSNRYYLDENGARHTGWLELHDGRYYFLEDGTMGRGQVFVEELDPRYFLENGQEIQLVNPWNAIVDDYTVDLVDYSSGYQIAAECLEPLRQMLSDCKAAGNTAIVASAYRTQEYQQKLFDRKVNYYISCGYSDAEAQIVAATVVAYPGTSEHQLGLAVDLVDISYQLLDEAQAQTPAQQWLMENSWRYGFILRYPDGKSELTGIIYEPWHYRYVGTELARELSENGLCLEEYLQALTES